METRDHYFTRLKWRIELSVKTEGEKVGMYLRLCGYEHSCAGMQGFFALHMLHLEF